MTLGVLAAAAASSASDDVSTGVIAFLIVAAMGVALVFLLRSMNKQFRKIAPPPDEPGEPGEPGDAAGGEQQGGAAARTPAQTPE